MICMIVGGFLGVWLGSLVGKYSYSPILSGCIFAIAGAVCDGILFGAGLTWYLATPKVEM